MCTVAKEVQADIVACQEINLDTTQPVVRSILYETLRKSWKRSRLSLGGTPTTFVHMYKPGRTMLASVNHVTGRVISSTADKWGRWVSKTTIISAYQVGPEASSPGKTTAATQQRSVLLQAQDPITDPRAAFDRDLRLYLQTCQAQDEDILILTGIKTN